MKAELARLCYGVLLATFFALVAGDGAGAFVPDGQWEGRWDPRDSCRDKKERRVTARIEDGKLHGEVDNQPESPGTFVAEIKPNGRFISTIKGLRHYDFRVYGKVTPSEIEAKWTGRNDCGPGEIVLHPVPTEPEAAPTESKSGRSNATSAQAALETLRAQGVITEEEYQAKLEALESKPPATVTAPSKRPPSDPRLVELDDLLISGAIGADEYLARRKAITGSSN